MACQRKRENKEERRETNKGVEQEIKKKKSTICAEGDETNLQIQRLGPKWKSTCEGQCMDEERQY